MKQSRIRNFFKSETFSVFAYLAQVRHFSKLSSPRLVSFPLFSFSTFPIQIVHQPPSPSNPSPPTSTKHSPTSGPNNLHRDDPSHRSSIPKEESTDEDSNRGLFSRDRSWIPAGPTNHEIEDFEAAGQSGTNDRLPNCLLQSQGESLVRIQVLFLFLPGRTLADHVMTSSTVTLIYVHLMASSACLSSASSY